MLASSYAILTCYNRNNGKGVHTGNQGASVQISHILGRSGKEIKTKVLKKVDLEKAVILKVPDEKEAAEVIIKIGGGLIEWKHLEKWVKRLKIKENLDMLRSLFVEQRSYLL
jgi:hypothetical protein